MKWTFVLLFVTLAVISSNCDDDPVPPPPFQQAEEEEEGIKSFIDEDKIVNVYDPKECKLDPPPSLEELEQFFEFKKTYNKVYKSAKEEMCKTVRVVYHIREIDYHNVRFAEGKETYKRDLTQYSDLSHDEKFDRLLMKDIPPQTHYRQLPASLPDLPPPKDFVDHVEDGLVGPVGTQNKCGSCYGWSGSVALEGQLRKCKITNESVSVQQMVDCPTSGVWGCKSGWPYWVYKWQMTGGIVLANKYPYQDKLGNCTYDPNDVIAYIEKPFSFDFTTVNGNATFIKQVVSSIGPVATIICVHKSLFQYSSGVYKTPTCCTKVSHAVAIVGYGTDPVGGDYWLIKNSWGTGWGQKGYGKIARGINLCISETQIQYPQVKTLDGKVCEFY